MKLLKVAADIIDPENTRPYAQGVTFADGAMSSTNNSVFLTGESGLTDDFDFTLPKEACVALTKFKSPVVGVLADTHTAKFFFENGSSLCSKLLVAKFPDIGPLFAGDWDDFNLTEPLLDLSCDHLEFVNGNVYYHDKDSVGLFENVIDKVGTITVNKKHVDYLFRVGNNLSVSSDGYRMKSLGENCVIVCAAKISE